MQIFKNNFASLLFLVLAISCQPHIDSAVSEVSEQQQFVTVEGVHRGIHSFSVVLPAEMMNKYELNEAAALQYADVHLEEQEDGSKIEFVHYVLVLMEDKGEIEALHAGEGLDLNVYNKLVIANFEEVHGDSFEILKSDSTIHERDQLKYIATEANLLAHEDIGDLKMYYKIVVLEGSTAYYQLFTWCLEEQRSTYESKMEAIIVSFKEL